MSIPVNGDVEYTALYQRVRLGKWPEFYLWMMGSVVSPRLERSVRRILGDKTHDFNWPYGGPSAQAVVT